MQPTALQVYLDTIATVFTAVLGLFSQVLEFLISNPVTLVGAGIAILMFVIHVIKGFIWGN